MTMSTVCFFFLMHFFQYTVKVDTEFTDRLENKSKTDYLDCQNQLAGTFMSFPYPPKFTRIHLCRPTLIGTSTGAWIWLGILSQQFDESICILGFPQMLLLVTWSLFPNIFMANMMMCTNMGCNLWCSKHVIQFDKNRSFIACFGVNFFGTLQIPDIEHYIRHITISLSPETVLVHHKKSLRVFQKYQFVPLHYNHVVLVYRMNTVEKINDSFAYY